MPQCHLYKFLDLRALMKIQGLPFERSLVSASTLANPPLFD